MKLKIVIIFSFIIFFFTHSTLFADTDVNTDLKISGVIYFEWAYLTGFQPGPALSEQPTFTNTDEGISDQRNNTFRINRVYLNIKKNFSETFSFRITTDVDTVDRNDLYLKYAYIQYRNTFFDFFGLQIQIGKIGTPTVGHITAISDYRWIYNDFCNKWQNLLGGFGGDASADLGFNLKFSFFNLIHLTGSYTNGEGFKSSETTDGKAYHGLLSIAPNFGDTGTLYINGYFKYETDASSSSYSDLVTPLYLVNVGQGNEVYYGFGIAWKSDFIKTGVNYFIVKDNSYGTTGVVFGPNTEVGTRVQNNYHLLDCWVNINLGAFFESFPLLILGRYGNGMIQPSLVANNNSRMRTYLLAGGLGWQFNSHFRVAAYYERYAYDVGRITIGYRNPKAASNFYVKTEIKF